MYLDDMFAITGPLRRGAVGPGVARLQIRLNAMDVKGSELLTPDGKFGRLTYEKLKNFQRKHDLRADGAFGPKSAAKLQFKKYVSSVNLERKVARVVSGMGSGAVAGLVNSPFAKLAMSALSGALSINGGIIGPSTPQLKSSKGVHAAAALQAFSAIATMATMATGAIKMFPGGSSIDFSPLNRVLANAQGQLLVAAIQPPESVKTVAMIIGQQAQAVATTLDSLFKGLYTNTAADDAKQSILWISEQIKPVVRQIGDWASAMANDGVADEDELQLSTQQMVRAFHTNGVLQSLAKGLVQQ